MLHELWSLCGIQGVTSLHNVYDMHGSNRRDKDHNTGTNTAQQDTACTFLTSLHTGLYFFPVYHQWHQLLGC
jgi:hypothetical protein